MTVTNDPTSIGTNGWTNPTYAYLDDANKATAVMAAKNTSIAGIWGTFGFTDPGGVTTITKVEIGTQHYLSTITSIIATMGREISWDGGTSWGSHTLSEVETEVTTETEYWFDVTADTAWTWAKLNDTNLRTRITCFQGNDASAFTMSLDVIFVRVTYGVNYSQAVTQAITFGANSGTVQRFKKRILMGLTVSGTIKNKFIRKRKLIQAIGVTALGQTSIVSGGAVKVLIEGLTIGYVVGKGWTYHISQGIRVSGKLAKRFSKLARKRRCS